MRVVRARGRVIQHPLSSDFFCSRGGKRAHRYALPGVPRCYIGSYDAYTNLISIWWGTIESKGLEGTFMRNQPYPPCDRKIARFRSLGELKETLTLAQQSGFGRGHSRRVR